MFSCIRCPEQVQPVTCDLKLRRKKWTRFPWGWAKKERKGRGTEVYLAILFREGNEV